MKKRLLGSLLFLLMSASAFAQIQFLRNKGNLPTEFTTPSSVKYKKDLEQIGSDEKRRARKDKDKFFLQSNFAIDGLLRSGKIIIEPEYSAYMGQIADALLGENRPLRSKVRFYIMRSSAVNAFATNDGSIFMSLGMLAQLENEAQLAFILSHEITHVEKKHALEFFIKARKIERGQVDRNVQRDESIRDRQLAKHAFSREQETEADDMGLTRFLATQYSLAATESAIDVLRYAYLPFDDVAFERNFFETDFIRFPKTMFRDSVRAIEGTMETEDDSKSTHPNLAKRRQALMERIKGKSNEGRKEFIVSETMFKRIQQQARYELPSIYNQNGEYQSAIYAAFLLKKAGGDETFVDKQVGQSLYNFSKYKNHSDITAYAEQFEADSVEGESQQVYHLFDKMTDKELNILTLSYLWRMNDKYPKDEELKRMKYDAFWELVNHHKMKMNDFSTEKIDSALLNAAPPSIAEKKDEKVEEEKPKEEEKSGKKKKKSKYEKIKEKQAAKAADVPKADWSKHALADLLAVEDFKKHFSDLEADAKAKDQEEIKSESELEKERAKRLPMNVKKVVFVNPFYARIDTRGDDFERLHLATEQGNQRFRDILKENAQLVGLQNTVLAAPELKAGDVEKFNDLVALNQWFSEQNETGKHFVVPTNQAQVEEIAKKYGTDYFVWTGVISARQYGNNSLSIFTSLWTFWRIPLIIKSTIDARNDALLFTMVYNVKTGRNETVQFMSLGQRDSDGSLHAHMYDMLLKIRGKGEKIKDSEKENENEKKNVKSSKNKKKKK
ncbi:MAG: hypothetical protein RL757_969 [Bacteroidota bacterium]|jgi:Zn-dependent protease with chaperone function